MGYGPGLLYWVLGGTKDKQKQQITPALRALRPAPLFTCAAARCSSSSCFLLLASCFLLLASSFLLLLASCFLLLARSSSSSGGWRWRVDGDPPWATRGQRPSAVVGRMGSPSLGLRHPLLVTRSRFRICLFFYSSSCGALRVRLTPGVGDERQAAHQVGSRVASHPPRRSPWRRRRPSRPPMDGAHRGLSARAPFKSHTLL
jgi:hypothetical protein